MSNPPKTPKQELFQYVTDLMNGGHAGTQAVFEDNAFSDRFLVYEPEKGRRQVLIRLPGNVVAHVHQEAVVSAIVDFTGKLPAEYSEYKFDYQKSVDCRNYWLHRTTPITEEIAPVLPLSGEGLTFHRLDFDPQEAETPLFDDFVSYFTHNQTAFMAFIGSLFDPKAPRQNYLWMQGEGGDGKGVMCRFLRQLFAHTFVACGSEGKNDKFFNSRLIGKRVGVFQDTQNASFVTSETFMTLSGGDPVFVEQKGKDGFTVDIPTMFIFSSNQMPNITSSKAHRRRAIIAPLRERKEEDYNGQVSTYEKRFYEERSGIVFKCLKAWVEMLKEHGKMVFDTSIVDDVAQDFESKYEAILNEHFKMDLQNFVGVVLQTEVYSTLRKLGRFSDKEVGSFNRYVERKGVQVMRAEGGSRPRYYKGLSLIKGALGNAERIDAIKEETY